MPRPRPSCAPMGTFHLPGVDPVKPRLILQLLILLVLANGTPVAAKKFSESGSPTRWMTASNVPTADRCSADQKRCAELCWPFS
jgi:hypothetical protein